MHKSPWMFRNRRKKFPYGWAVIVGQTIINHRDGQKDSESQYA